MHKGMHMYQFVFKCVEYNCVLLHNLSFVSLTTVCEYFVICPTDIKLVSDYFIIL